MDQNKPQFPQQDQPDKLHGTTDNTSEKEKYLRNSGKIEGLPSQNELSKIGRSLNETDKNDSSHLTDRSGEEEKEDYINTDERKRDLDKRGF